MQMTPTSQLNSQSVESRGVPNAATQFALLLCMSPGNNKLE